MGRVKDQLFQMFDMPSDVTNEWPKIEWIQHARLQIENHQGIQFYSDKALKIQVKENNLLVIGENLKIKTINRYVIIITGTVKELRYSQ